ncbi:hypothetical protein HK104_007479 [Borealophlyctis nickersoniae]|nr:hypothetical protein HK104_007479 [Borealophlyctis nickersoniae]
MAVEDEFPRFSPYEEVRYDDRVKLLAWCPKRELLAILFAKGMAAIARGSSKKFSIFPRGEGSISALAWRPDGRVVALGYTTGLVELRDVESSGELVHAFQETHAEITCISWVAESDLSQGTFEVNGGASIQRKKKGVNRVILILSVKKSRKRDNGPGIMDALPELSTIPNSTNRYLVSVFVGPVPEP